MSIITIEARQLVSEIKKTKRISLGFSMIANAYSLKIDGEEMMFVKHADMLRCLENNVAEILAEENINTVGVKINMEK